MARFRGIQSAARNSAYLLIAQFSNILTRFVYLLVLVRSLTATDYGILNYGLSWYLTLIPLTYLGADVVLSREIARRGDTAPDLLGITLGLRSIAIVVVVAASALVASIAEKDGHVRSLLLLLSVALIGRSFWMWGASVFTAFEETRQVMRLEVTFRIFEVAVLIGYLATSRANIFGIAIIHAGSWCLQGAITVATVRLRHSLKFRRPDRKWAKALKDGIPGAIFTIGVSSFLQLPIVLFRQVEGVGDSLGFFALAFQLFAYIQVVPYVISVASLPVLSRSAHREDGKDRTATLLLMAIIPVAGALIATSASWFLGPLVEALFGARYVPAAALLGDALWLLIPMSLAMLFQQMLFSNSVRSLVGVMAPVLGVAAMAASFPGLTHAIGPSGTLASIGIGLSIWLICAAVELARAGFFMKRRDAV